MLLVENQNFQGLFFPSENKDRAIITVSGSDGGIGWAKQIAGAFSANGIASLALSYWRTKNTPKTLSLIAIETIQYAVSWMKENGYAKIGIYGVSKGAELALTAGSLISQIKFVIAASPSCCVFEGIAKPSYSGASSWTWQGKPLPYASFDNVPTNAIAKLLKNREYGFLQEYTA
ncbi:MAG: hypothetical protein LBU94_01460, partial [Clostridiales bacterium]|nr:hypothetical protein [Clostridiales bacterium]